MASHAQLLRTLCTKRGQNASSRLARSSKSSLLPGRSLLKTRAASTTHAFAPMAEEETRVHGSGSSSNGESNGNGRQSVPSFPRTSDSEQLLRMRHTAAHVMAMAVQRLYPSAHVTIGPWIENGFYYDFDCDTAFTPEDLKAIQKEMKRIIKAKEPLQMEELSRGEALRRINELGEPYKLEILEDIPKDEPVTIYHIGDQWWDLCAGPHVAHTGELNPKAIELESVAAAHWRGDEDRPMLQRIYGTAFESEEQLQAYKKFKEEAARRDHRVLGKQLNLFSIQDEVGGGLVLWHPRGGAIRNCIEEFWKQMHLRNGYQLLNTPHIANLDLWKTSGHYYFYSDSLFNQIDVENEHYQLKPMNCPFHIQVFKEQFWSYRDLPQRWAELGTVYRYERSGTMHGLFRVRGFTQDDAHIFCLPEQVADEIHGVLQLIKSVLSTFGFTKYETYLSTRPENAQGTDSTWDQAEEALKTALENSNTSYELNEGDGAFYGPKIDVQIQDAIGRRWQCSTIQLDFNLPERFDLSYIDRENSKQRPIMIHRAIFGSIERFFGVLTEHYAGAFPLWMAPEQVRLLPVSDAFRNHAAHLVHKLRSEGVRAELAPEGEKLGKQIRNAERDKVPVMGIIGENEQLHNQVSVRTYRDGDRGPFNTSEVLNRILRANDLKSAEF